MDIFYYTTLFMLGIALGSFSNVLIFRYRPERNVFARPSMSGRSHCMHCGHALRWYELLPIISFVMQRGRCRSCAAKISWQYPLVECVGGAITAGVPLFLNSFFGISSVSFFSFTLPFWYYAVLAVWVLVFFVLLLITVIDFRLFIIPNELNLILGILGVVVAFIMATKMGGFILPFRTSFLQQYILLSSPFQNVFANHLLGALIGFCFFLALSLLTRGRGIGFGDVKLGLAMGMVLGWPDIALTIILSFVIGGLISAVLMGLKKKHMRDKVPFAPFLVAGFILTFFLGAAVVGAYFSFFNL